MKLVEHLQDPFMCSALRKMDHHMVKTLAQEPHPNEIAKMLEELFGGIVRNVSNQTALQNKCLSKMAKAADEIGFDCS